jgi:hypothetical protein
MLSIARLNSVHDIWMIEYGALEKWYWQGKLQYSEKSHFFHHKSQMGWPKI